MSLLSRGLNSRRILDARALTGPSPLSETRGAPEFGTWMDPAGQEQLSGERDLVKPL